MSSDLDRALERVDRAAAGLPEREHPLEGFHQRIEKSEPDDAYRSDNSGLREAGRALDERRRHPVKEFFDENHLEDGARVIKTLGPDGAVADPKATFKQGDLRRVAVDLTDDRRKVAAVKGEIGQAFEEGREYNQARVDEKYVIDAALAQFPADMTAEQFEALGNPNSPSHDPEKYQRGLQLKALLAASNEALEQQQAEQRGQEQQAAPEVRQAQEQERHQARVHAEQQRVEYEAARNLITQKWQETGTTRQQIWQIAIAEFPELQRGVSQAQLHQHLAQTNDPRLGRFEQLNAAAAQVAHQQAQVWQAAAEVDAHSNVAQKQHMERSFSVVEKQFAEMHPELKDPNAMVRVSRNIGNALLERGMPKEQAANLKTLVMQLAPEWQPVAMEALYTMGRDYGARQIKSTLNEKLVKAPPVQRPGTGQHRAHGESQELDRLSARLDQKPNIKNAAALLNAKRAAAARR